MNSESTYLHFYIVKNDTDQVSRQVDDQAASPSSYHNTSATILYRETLTEDANFKLCYDVSDNLIGSVIYQNYLQYGY